jgi:hypothetical protein
MNKIFGATAFALMFVIMPVAANAQSYYYPGGYPGYNSPVIYSVQPTYQQSYGYQYPQQYNYYTPQYQQYGQQYYYQPQYQQQSQSQQQYQQYQSSYYAPQQYVVNSNNPPYTGSYPTGDRDPIGNQLCYYPSYGARYSCDSDPHQWVYDYWTGTWY